MEKPVKKNGGSVVIAVVLMLTMFVFGFVVGMVVLYFTTPKNVKSEEQNIVQPVVIETETTPEIKIYVPDRKRVLGKIPINSYNPDNFVMEDGFLSYYNDEGEKISHIGVDLSYHQEKINWDELENSGIEFVILRCGYRGYSEGGLIEDEKFREYATECNARNIPLGVYFFTQAITVEEAIEEADFVLSIIEEYDISYPVVLDTENVSDNSARTNTVEITPEFRTDMCVAFMEHVKENGYYPMIYASENWIRRELIPERIQEYDLWAAQYIDKNDYLYDFTIWQYTESGRVPGINEAVDIDVCMVDYASFIPELRKEYLGDEHVTVINIESENTVVIEDDEAVEE